MKIETKIVKGERRLYQVYANGRITPLLIVFDNTCREWDLCTDTEHVMAGYSKAVLLRRLETLLGALGV